MFRSKKWAHLCISKTKKSQKFYLQVNEQVNEISWIRGQQTCPLYIWDLKITWTWRWRKRGFAGKAWNEDAATLAGKLQIKVEQVALSARLTREDKVTLSCVNSMMSFRKTREVLLDWYLNDLLLEEKFVLPAMTPVSLKKNRISSRETWGYDRSSGYQLFVARLFRFPLF